MKETLLKKGKDITFMRTKLKSLVDNKFQPPPEIVEVETKQNKEVINEDLKPNQIRIRMTASERLRAADATYVKYHF